MYACLYQPPLPGQPAGSISTLVSIAQEFSPRYERHRDDLVSIDVSGLERLVGTARTIGGELCREAAARGLGVHVAIAATRMAALVLAQAGPGLTLVEPGREAAALAPLPIGLLERIDHGGTQSAQAGCRSPEPEARSLSAFHRWGLKTLGDLAALPPGALASRLGQAALVWQAVARGEDVRPLVPTRPEERFVATLDLDWPIEGLEPLSFVLTRLLEPLSTRLERQDRGAAVLHVELGLITPDAVHTRRLQLPSPIRDVRTLRALALLDLDAHPPPAAVDRVTLVIDPTPGRVLQHTLFRRAHPTPDQLSTLVARLGALMGHDRIGRPSPVDSYRPGAFELKPFAPDHDLDDQRRNRRARREDDSLDHDDRRGDRGARREHDSLDHDDQRRTRGTRREGKGFYVQNSASSAVSALNVVVAALRRCRQPVPARVVVADGRPARVTTDRRAFGGGAVVTCAGPWRTSGDWWSRGGCSPWDRDEWDVALNDGAVYRIFQDRETARWFIDAIAD